MLPLCAYHTNRYIDKKLAWLTAVYKCSCFRKLIIHIQRDFCKSMKTIPYSFVQIFLQLKTPLIFYCLVSESSNKSWSTGWSCNNIYQSFASYNDQCHVYYRRNRFDKATAKTFEVYIIYILMLIYAWEYSVNVVKTCLF